MLTAVPVPPRPAPAALARLLPPDIDPSTGRGLRHPDAATVWYGVVWGRLGRGDLAWATWDAVDATGELGPWIAAERGRLLRELGAHAQAEAREAPALAVARDPVDVAMLRLSLAADAIGLGDPAAAERLLAAGRQALDAAPPGPRRDRQALRATWVAVEVTLVRGADTSRPVRTDDEVVAFAAGLPSWDAGSRAPSWPPLYRAGSDAHRAKGALFAGVLEGEVGLLAAAARIAPPALRWAVLLARAALDPTATDARSAAARARAEVVPPPPLAAAARPADRAVRPTPPHP